MPFAGPFVAVAWVFSFARAAAESTARPTDNLVAAAGAGDSFADMLANVPGYCPGCNTSSYLQDVRISVISNIYSAMNWAYFGHLMISWGDAACAFAALAVARRVSDLLGLGLSSKVDDCLEDLWSVHGPSPFLQVSNPEALLWSKDGHLLQDIFQTCLLPWVSTIHRVSGPMLTASQFRYFLEGVAYTAPAVPNPAAAMPALAVRFAGVRRALRLNSCQVQKNPPGGPGGKSRPDLDILSIAALPLGAVYVFNPKCASSAIRSHLSAYAWGPRLEESRHQRLVGLHSHG